MTRVRASRVLAVLGSLFWGWVFFGLQDLLTVFVEGPSFAAHYVLESGWGLLFLVLTGVPLLGFAFAPWSGALLLEVAAVGVALLVAAAVAGSPRHLLPGLGVLATAALLGALARPELAIRVVPRRADPALLVLLALVIGPAVVYGVRMARGTTDPESTAGLDHYPVQGALGFAFLLVPLVLVVGWRARGWLLVGGTAVVAVGWIGIESIVYPERLGSLGSTWGWLATAWAVVLAVVMTHAALRVAPDGDLAVGPPGG